MAYEQLLVSIQDLLSNPVCEVVANPAAHELYFSARNSFFNRIRQNPHANTLKTSRTETTKGEGLGESEISEAIAA